MSKILIIVAHPKIDSLSMAMAQKYKDIKESMGLEVELLDLYREENPQPFFTYEDSNNISTDSMKKYQKKIEDANELVFVFPYWWGSYPAILHNFIDWNFSRGFAFEYVDSRPKGRLQGRSVTVFTTTGAPSFVYALSGANRRIKTTFKKQVVEFCGMNLRSFNIFGGVDSSTAKSDKILQKVESIAKS